jgi:glycosyltransferase involved in cell wall biosynthesis
MYSARCGVPVTLYYNTVPLARSAVIPSTTAAGSDELGTCTRVVYAGALLDDACIKELIQAQDYLDESFHLVLAGKVAEPDILDAVARRKGRVTYVGWLDYLVLSKLLQTCSVGVALYRPVDDNHKMCAPTKIFEYLAAGLAVVATWSRHNERLLKETGVGVLLPSCDPEVIADGIRRAAESRRPVESRGRIVARFRERLCSEVLNSEAVARIEAAAEATGSAAAANSGSR